MICPRACVRQFCAAFPYVPLRSDNATFSMIVLAMRSRVEAKSGGGGGGGCDMEVVGLFTQLPAIADKGNRDGERGALAHTASPSRDTHPA